MAKNKDNAAVSLPDGLEVTFGDDNAMAGSSDAAVATVITADGPVRVGKARVITEARLDRRSMKTSALPKALGDHWAIFSSIESCGDVCHGAAWLFGPGVRLLLLEDAGPRASVLWKPDGQQVVVEGGGQLVAVHLSGLVLLPLDGYSFPAYSPDGRLFVRGKVPQKDTVHEVHLRGGLRLVTDCPGSPPPGDPEDPEAAAKISPVAFPDAGTMAVQFLRARGPGCVRQIKLSAIAKPSPHGRPPRADPPRE